MSQSVQSQKIQMLVKDLGIETTIKEFSQSTRTAQEAADTIGCGVEEIAKSIIFKGSTSGEPILVIASGINRVDEKKVQAIVGEALEKADADFVLEKTGFVIGGVPPMGHITEIKTLVDEDLMRYGELWASAGTTNAVFNLTPQNLVKITRGEIADVKQNAAVIQGSLN